MAIKNLSTALLAVALIGAVITSALDPARMALPAEFENDAERLLVTGFGGRTKGSYRLGTYAGVFRRGDARSGVENGAYTGAGNNALFTLSGPGIDRTIGGNCALRRGAISVGFLSFDSQQVTYRCSYQRGDYRLADSFALGQAQVSRGNEIVATRALRNGAANIGGHEIQLRSVHGFRGGGRHGSPVPVGYVLEHADQLAAAIELTDVNPTILLRAGLPPELRESLLVAAMSLALLQDSDAVAIEE